ncbi:hypothetical protein SLEP1_g25970 [Rubroshorea leprosula]|uniref:Retrotransposon gag domain-containing protein n=1 Tax=Rubroshorea leprosula TaxID=152421 RepID=A0AAV5JV72_9ROSI|nr:hypothetical protein SLEP1_g25970 [Rubroshorea leprosula]
MLQNVLLVAAQRQHVEETREHDPQHSVAAPNDLRTAQLNTMQQQFGAQNASDALMCKILSSVLCGNTRTWYYSLKPNSISSYVKMAMAFTTKFSSQRLIKKTTTELMQVVQREGESLKNYINRFNDTVLEMNSFDQAVGIAVITQGLSHERFRDSLIKQPLLHLKRSPTWMEKGPSKKKFKAIQNRDPLSTAKVDKPGTGVEYQQPPPPLPTPARIIHMKNGALEAGEMSSKQHKFYMREVRHQNQAQKRKLHDEGWKDQPITFTSADLGSIITPHNDLLVTTVIVNNCEVHRVLVDIKSAPDIMGNQEVAKHCYMTLINRPRKDKESVQLLEPMQSEAPSTQQVMGVELLDNRPDDEARAALTSADMPKVPTSVAVHKLSNNPLKKSVAQKRRLFGGEKLQAIREEVQKLLQAGFVRRVDYCEWVVNPVMVKKSNDKWRMCIVYTNLNDACTKDCHPMPNIDKLVEAALGNERLRLLDAYLGYHQVHMASEDEVKTSFYAGDEIYCYKLGGLRRDIVVKSPREEDHLTNLVETFNNLRRYSMKLTLTKCTFGVESGKFLGFMVSRRRIEVNLGKIKAIKEMKPSRSIKDVQHLIGRVAVLHRFISKSADKCLPFFKVLRAVAQGDETGKP